MRIVVIIFGLVLLLVGGYAAISYSGLSPRVWQKKRLLDRYLTERGYQTHYVLLSGYRPPWLNRLMPLSARKSVHQQGQAIDLFVFDINGNDRFDPADLRILSDALDHLDRQHPRYRGGVGLYRQSFPRMVHFDVSGRHRHWDY
ncbi:DUF882 domain-containing protein [Rudanella paleaurantiibacter]|uniref:DUF882 domain-containing protein n=1 Tax=Rudanella paleaurantiibacter TaxID=2614655 RepID=A0A7J5U5J6_9BACT|nr:DUF882 domain-containing protein [Rudanella paleaurantiibacter]KAB7732953.1 DUF882 domain-containing protein [Rudanella paleaurantiibacter]